MFHAPLAIVTGAASGIGLAAVKYFLERRMRVVMIDNRTAVHDVAHGLQPYALDHQAVLSYTVDVSKRLEVLHLQTSIARLGPIEVLLNSAGVMRTTPALPSGIALDDLRENWDQVYQVNVRGVINMCQVFGPVMASQSGRSRIINTGSKQGITCPPGNAGYNVSKAAVKVYTEQQVAHELRDRGEKRCTAHLFIPGWVWTPMNGEGAGKDKPDGSWTAAQTVEYAFPKILDENEFYVICPDGETSTALDLARIEWSVGDVIYGRSALSRWDPNYKEEFERFVSSRVDTDPAKRYCSDASK